MVMLSCRKEPRPRKAIWPPDKLRLLASKITGTYFTSQSALWLGLPHTRIIGFQSRSLHLSTEHCSGLLTHQLPYSRV